MFDVTPPSTEQLRCSPSARPEREALARHPVLIALPQALQDAAHAQGRLIHQATGQRRTTGGSLGFLIEGALAVYDERNLACIERLGTGATFGWETALTTRTSEQELLALLDTSWLAIPAALPAQVMGISWVERMFGRHALDRLRRIQSLSACQVVHAVSARTATLIQQLATSSATEEIRTTQAALADALGVQRTSVNAAIKDLEAAGAVRVRRGSLRITCASTLACFACGCGCG
ncbi:MAG TPA: helix-turn-helix domain-containing protein [Brevundimonas sp.]|jgi:CRP-like cAMP-binding protein|uniref:Crp/Fnr family transcriptional regulator n=1 Tax=Brevundimonas sp. TaxID=1871086 RepID=UPI002E130161|nr:helix-turn-helix domain-containing protein [Brevundimonas sp.]